MIQYSFLQVINSFRVFQFSLKTHCQYHFRLAFSQEDGYRPMNPFNIHCQSKWLNQSRSISLHVEDTFDKEKFHHCLSNIHGCLMGKLDLEHQTYVITQLLDHHHCCYLLVEVVFRLPMYQSLDFLVDDMTRLAQTHHWSIPRIDCSVESYHYELKKIWVWVQMPGKTEIGWI